MPESLISAAKHVFELWRNIRAIRSISARARAYSFVPERIVKMNTQDVTETVMLIHTDYLF